MIIVRKYLLTLTAFSFVFTHILPFKASALNVNGQSVGNTREDILTVDQHCSWNDSDSGEAIYSPREGEVIVGYEKISSDTWEGSGFDIDRTPAGYSYSSYSKVRRKYRQLINALASSSQQGRVNVGGQSISGKKVAKYKARLEQELSSLNEATSKLRTSHSTLAIDWRCKGSGNAFDQKRGKVAVRYKVVVMYLPNPQEIQTHISDLSSLGNIARDRVNETFGHMKNSRLMATENRTEPMPGHINWAQGQTRNTVEKEILSDLKQARNEIAQSPSLQSCRAFGHMKNGMLTLLKGKTEPMAGHVNWCKNKLREGNWDQVVHAMKVEFVKPIQKEL